MGTSKNKGINRDHLTQYLDDLLESNRFSDYCPNGLQVEGKPLVRKVVTGVTASLALVEAAVQHGADAIFVHHGLFWKGDDMRVVGWKAKRLALLMQHGINLYAYHLPLDAHPTLGNNAQLGKLLGFKADAAPKGRFGGHGLGWMGSLPKPMRVRPLHRHIEAKLARNALQVGISEDVLPHGESDGPLVKRIAWCTGGAQNYIEAAAQAGAQVFVSGEISEQTTHLARELGITYIAAGHHATERGGAKAVGAHLASKFGLDVSFVDVPNPA
jgi:dinuclear metal center YbgI/SA1388 family protein